MIKPIKSAGCNRKQIIKSESTGVTQVTKELRSETTKTGQSRRVKLTYLTLSLTIEKVKMKTLVSTLRQTSGLGWRAIKTPLPRGRMKHQPASKVNIKIHIATLTKSKVNMVREKSARIGSTKLITVHWHLKTKNHPNREESSSKLLLCLRL